MDDYLRSSGLLDPGSFWETHQPASMLGRGAVVILRGEMDIVVRKYRHGGLFRGLTGDRFYISWRPFRELAITHLVRAIGIPTVDILAAIVSKTRTLGYHGYLVTSYIPGAPDAAAYLSAQPSLLRRHRVIRYAASHVRCLHHNGIFHADLNLKNFLVVDGPKPAVYLIDFDRAIHTPKRHRAARMRNIRRLHRSVEKLGRGGLPVSVRDKELFCRVYASGDRTMQALIETYMRRQKWYTMFHRLGWWVAHLLYPSDKSSRKSAT
jgi:tRNA A-37 threonylcarbamoyl transferase component Bud32